MKRIEVNRLIALLCVSVMVASNVFFFGPFNIYNGNTSEFNFPLILVLSRYLFPFLMFCLIVSIIGLLLKKNLYKRYVSILLAIGVLLYLQGNILVWDYGLFGAGNIDFHKDSWRGWIDTSIWISMLIIFFIFYRKISEKVIFISITLFTLQFLAICYTTIQNPKILQANTDYLNYSKDSIINEKILQFSSKDNILHIIPDCLQSTIFKEIIDSDPDHYYNAFNGFTFFTETTGSYPTTFFSIPAFLSSQRYKNEMPMADYLDSVFNGKNILSVLLNNGHEIDLVTLKWYEDAPNSYFFDIPTPYNDPVQKRLERESETIRSWVWFRSLPYFLKEYYYYSGRKSTQGAKLKVALDPNNPDPKLRAALADSVRTYSIANKDFLKDIITNSTIKRDKPVYKFLHVHQMHWPLFLTKNCEAVESLPYTWDNIRIQAKCGVDEIVEVLNKLKSLGIYDSSLIVINADHGYPAVPNSLEYFKFINLENELDGTINNLAINKEAFATVLAPALPTMLIKPPYSEGVLKVSDAHVELTDIPDTITSILGIQEAFDGQSVYEVAPGGVRKRKYFFYEKHPPKRTETNYCTKITEFIIKGSVFDMNSWRRGRIYAEPEFFQTATIDFGNIDSMDFLISGWSFPEELAKEGLTARWAVSHNSSIALSLPRDKTLRLDATMRNFLTKQEIILKLDGEEIGTWELSHDWNWEKHSIIIKPDPRRPDVSKLEFIFSRTRLPESNDKRELAVLLDSITLNEIK